MEDAVVTTNGFTAVQTRMYNILRDGRPHTMAELHGCCYSGPPTNVRPHISWLRKFLRPQGLDVVFREGHYQLVRLLSQDEG